MKETKEEKIQQWQHWIDWVEARGGKWFITEDGRFAFEEVVINGEVEAKILESIFKLSGIAVIRESDLTGGNNHEN